MPLTEVNSLGIKDLEVKRGDIAADAIDGTKLADDACNSEHYTNGSIDHEHLANDAVDGDNIADDSINSEHYVDGSIDTAHIANDQITNALMADDAIGIAQLSATGTASSSTFLRGDNAWAAAGGGKILQVVGSSYNTAALINTTTKTTTSMYQEITPSKAGSKMLFWCAGHYSQNHNGGAHGPQVIVSIYKKIGSGSDTEIHQVTYDYTATNASVYYSHHFAASYFDNTATSNTTDVIRYTIYAKCLYADHQMRFNPSSYTSFIVQEWDA